MLIMLMKMIPNNHMFALKAFKLQPFKTCSLESKSQKFMGFEKPPNINAFQKYFIQGVFIVNEGIREDSP